MKKRIFGMIASTMALVMTLGMTAFAAGSAGTGSISTGDVTGGTSVETNVPVSVGGEQAQVKEIAENQIANNAAINTINGVTYKAVATVWYGEISGSLTGATDITIKNGAIAAGKTYMVLHYSKVTNTWDSQIAKNVKDGSLVATFTDLSPVVIMEVTGGAGATSPKTGEVAPVAAVMAVICLAAAAVSFKKAGYIK